MNSFIRNLVVTKFKTDISRTAQNPSQHRDVPAKTIRYPSLVGYSALMDWWNFRTLLQLTIRNKEGYIAVKVTVKMPWYSECGSPGCSFPFPRPMIHRWIYHWVCDAWPVRRQPMAGTNLYCLVNMCVNNLPRVITWMEWPGLEPASSRLQVRRPNHYANTPHYIEVLFHEYPTDVFGKRLGYK